MDWEKFNQFKCEGCTQKCATCDTSYCVFCDPCCTNCGGISILLRQTGKVVLRTFGQGGEDGLVLSIFPEVMEGYFVEIGALDGLRFSNTYLFEKLGWKGICVEAHPDYVEMLRVNRQGAEVVHAACGQEDMEFVDFHCNALGTCSTLDGGLEEEFARRYHYCFDKFETKRVPMISLETLLDMYEAPLDFELLSIDVEGGEPQVLEGMNWKKYRPKIAIIEALNPGLERFILGEMGTVGYQLARKVANNMFFCEEDELAHKIEHAKPTYHRTTVRHPLHNRCDSE